ncbi:tRNA lysidine(34) synthetase TilS [Methylocapsa acidiphila]|uniref:tRNA lysidine(34) synthetase TilS n=1 Tax=Methylocapsa acidiphila TaxID=133552 RepID=UPI00040CD571|nr:tRNA lysidine(34) synthetase TilS [Methylocapsa acidiphila]
MLKPAPGEPQADLASRGADGNFEPSPSRSIGVAQVDAIFPANVVAEIFESWRKTRKILLAVSGGPDSVAMMLLAAEWTRFPGAPLLFVATVDHGLRKESRLEAEQVARWSAALGLPHKLLAWNSTSVKTRIQERAREARYELLFAHAAEIGADIVATAHHADDQAETILFRLLRGSGLGGLSGMAASQRLEGVTLSRPLLQTTKAELIALCEAKGHPFFDDPSNRDPAFARARLRGLSGFLAEQGLDRRALLRLGRRAARAEAALAHYAAAAGADVPAIRDENRLSLDLNWLADRPEEVFLRVLAEEIRNLVDRSRILRLERLEALTLELRRALMAGEAFSATLGGCRLRLGRDGALVIAVETERRRGFAKTRAEPCVKS